MWALPKFYKRILVDDDLIPSLSCVFASPQIQDFYDEALDGKEILINVMAAMGVEQVVGVTRRDEPKK